MEFHVTSDNLHIYKSHIYEATQHVYSFADDVVVSCHVFLIKNIHLTKLEYADVLSI